MYLKEYKKQLWWHKSAALAILEDEAEEQKLIIYMGTE